MKSLFLAALLCTVPMASHPFKHDLHPTVLEGSGRVMLCIHGFGHNYTHAESIRPYVDQTLVTFNCPDHGNTSQFQLNATYGTPQELLPTFYMLKRCIIEEGAKEIDLYGFSAGGAVVVNVIASLKTNRHDAHLKDLGIDAAGKEQILQALQKGTIILDTPMKSIEELIADRGESPGLLLFKWRHQLNDLRPIDQLHHLDGFNVVVHFQIPDTVLSNRDDDLFIEKLQKNKNGTLHVVKGFDGGHNRPHPSLWKYYNDQRTD